MPTRAPPDVHTHNCAHMQVPKRLSNAVQALLAPCAVGDSSAYQTSAASTGASTPNAAAALGSVKSSSAGAGSGGADTEEQELQGHVLAALGKIALQDSSLASKVGSILCECGCGCGSLP